VRRGAAAVFTVKQTVGYNATGRDGGVVVRAAELEGGAVGIPILGAGHRSQLRIIARLHVAAMILCRAADRDGQVRLGYGYSNGITSQTTVARKK